MKKCPFCGADIEESAQFCLYCMQSLTKKEQILLHKKKKPQWMIIIAAIVAVLLILTAIWSINQIQLKNRMSFEDSNLNSTPPSNQTDPTDTMPVADSSHIHSYSEENTDSKYQKEPATCTTLAVYYYSCSCGEVGSETFPYGETAEHTIVTERGYSATCKTPGLTDGKHCSVCNTVFSTQTQTPLVNHTYDNSQDKDCNVCKYVRVLNCSHTKTITLPAVPATCTAGGFTEGKKCSLCEEILTAQTTISPLGHTVVTDQAIAPTCTTAGKTAGKHCGTCNIVLVAQVTLDAKGHTEVTDPPVAANCTAGGKTEGKHCATCNVVLVPQQPTPALGHNFGPGNNLSNCTVCGAQPSHTHSYTVKNTATEYQKDAANCLSPAVYYYSCSCGEKGSETFSSGEKGEHTIITVPSTPPSGCTVSGWTEGSYCSVCSQDYAIRNEIFAPGHTFRLGDSTSTCLTCGQSDQTYVIRSSELPIYLNNTFRIDGGTYTIRKTIDGWQVKLLINYTNISSDTTSTGPRSELKNAIWGGPCQAETLLPGQSGTGLQYFHIPFYDHSGTYDLVFE